MCTTKMIAYMCGHHTRDAGTRTLFYCFKSYIHTTYVVTAVHKVNTKFTSVTCIQYVLCLLFPIIQQGASGLAVPAIDNTH